MRACRKLCAAPVCAAEINVLTAGAVLEAEKTIAAGYEKETGNKVVFATGTVGQIQEKLKAGATVDVIVVSTAAYPGLEMSGAIAGGTGKVLGRIGIGVGVLGHAQRFLSTPGKHDGLYWPSTNAADESPLGAAFAQASTAGYQIRVHFYASAEKFKDRHGCRRNPIFTATSIVS